MKTLAALFPILAALAVWPLTASGQTYSEPMPLAQGEVPLPVSGVRATGYYTYTPPANQIVTLWVPSADANVYLSPQPSENPSYSELPVMKRAFYDSDTCRFGFFAPVNLTLYIKVSFLCWELPDEGFNIRVETQDINYRPGYLPEDPIHAEQGELTYLPLTVNPSDDTLQPVYLDFTTDQYGYLEMYFEPSVSQIEYALLPDGEYTTLRHTYIKEEAQTIGAKALLTIAPDQHIGLRVRGFEPVLGTFTQIDPEPGTMCEFPLSVTPGEIELPAEAGDYYYIFLSEIEGTLKITSGPPAGSDLDGANLGTEPGNEGFTRLMLDCNGFGAVTHTGTLSLSTPVWDNMEYLLHISRTQEASAPTLFTLTIEPEGSAVDPLKAAQPNPEPAYTPAGLPAKDPKGITITKNKKTIK